MYFLIDSERVRKAVLQFSLLQHRLIFVQLAYERSVWVYYLKLFFVFTMALGMAHSLPLLKDHTLAESDRKVVWKALR